MAQAIESAVDAPGEQSRQAYMDLANHYWSMHALAHGLPRSAKARALALGGGQSAPPLKWAA
jgi:hypothetical protein